MRLQKPFVAISSSYSNYLPTTRPFLSVVAEPETAGWLQAQKRIFFTNRIKQGARCRTSSGRLPVLSSNLDRREVVFARQLCLEYHGQKRTFCRSAWSRSKNSGFKNHSIENKRTPSLSLDPEPLNEFTGVPSGDDKRQRWRPRSSVQVTGRERKAFRQSPSSDILETLDKSLATLYHFPRQSSSSSEQSIQQQQPHFKRRQDRHSALLSRISLQSILKRYIASLRSPSVSQMEFTRHEQDLLKAKGYSILSVQVWAASILNEKSLAAAHVFQPGVELPPLFLVLLYLRRKLLRNSSLSVVMHHMAHRSRLETIPWESLKEAVLRLLRHARATWPEGIPWIASFFVEQLDRVVSKSPEQHTPKKLPSDLTRFCNYLLRVLSLSTKTDPFRAAMHLQKAQFHVLQFMATCKPALIVDETGFRSIAKVQLIHAKTDQEKEWALLKGPSWPPWKENRNAMDEDKGYDFGASRASRVLHRMYEAGYDGRTWAKLVEMYAGWDTDSSPTIQTRSILSDRLLATRDRTYSEQHLWVSRIRTTRTRREAWAAFLAYENSKLPPHEDVYLAMFEKLYYDEKQVATSSEPGKALEDDVEEGMQSPLPGDMREVFAEPSSPLNLLYVSESLPTYDQLVHRMGGKGIQPSGKLLAFMMETLPDFDTVMRMLESADNEQGRVLRTLTQGNQAEHDCFLTLPSYMQTAFFRLLCRFGRLDRTLPDRPSFLPAQEHAFKFRHSRQHLMDYGYALLLRTKPRHRPIWTAFMRRIWFFNPRVNSQDRNSPSYKHSRIAWQYRTICNFFEEIAQLDLDVDDALFHLLCTATRSAAQLINEGRFTHEDTQFALQEGLRILRSSFSNLVGATAYVPAANRVDDRSTSPSPHIPGPAELHAYVRALGALYDFEGLYSLASWLAKNHLEVTERAKAQHSGCQLLFRAIVAVRAVVEGRLEANVDCARAAPEDVAHLIMAEIESVREWGGWPADEYVERYKRGNLRRAMPLFGS